MGMFKSDPPPPPDMSGVVAASKESAQLAYKLGQDQLAWAKEQFAHDSAISDRVASSFLDTQEYNTQKAKEDRAWYEEQYRPLERNLIDEANSYNTQARRDQEMGRAGAAVSQQFEAARDATMRDLESFGINPGATRYAALDTGIRTQQAAATAAAENQAGLATDATARALRSEAINVGRGYPGQVQGQFGTALQSGSGAVNVGLATTASGANTMGTAPQWQGIGNQAIGQWGNALTGAYNMQMQQYNAANQSSSGLGSALGLGLGLFGKSMGLPFAEGGQVPPAASPTRGAAIDDVPARLTAGEFVVPKDVTAWKGEEFFQKLIDQSRKAKDIAPANPTTAPVGAGVPTFQSRPTALSVG